MICEAMDDQGEDCGAPARRVVNVRRRLGEWQRWGFCEDHLTVPEVELVPAGFLIGHAA